MQNYFIFSSIYPSVWLSLAKTVTVHYCESFVFAFSVFLTFCFFSSFLFVCLFIWYLRVFWTYSQLYFIQPIVNIFNNLQFCLRPMAPRRTRSEMDLQHSLTNGPYPEGEFYTAIGPDGKYLSNWARNTDLVVNSWTIVLGIMTWR